MFILWCSNKLNITTCYAHKCTKCRKMALWSHESQETLGLLTDSFLTVPFLAGKSCNSTTPILFNTHVIKSLSVLRGILAFLFFISVQQFTALQGKQSPTYKSSSLAWTEAFQMKMYVMESEWERARDRELKKSQSERGQLFKCVP